MSSHKSSGNSSNSSGSSSQSASASSNSRSGSKDSTSGGSSARSGSNASQTRSGSNSAHSSIDLSRPTSQNQGSNVGGMSTTYQIPGSSATKSSHKSGIGGVGIEAAMGSKLFARCELMTDFELGNDGGSKLKTFYLSGSSAAGSSVNDVPTKYQSGSVQFSHLLLSRTTSLAQMAQESLAWTPTTSLALLQFTHLQILKAAPSQVAHLRAASPKQSLRLPFLPRTQARLLRSMSDTSKASSVSPSQSKSKASSKGSSQKSSGTGSKASKSSPDSEPKKSASSTTASKKSK